MTQVISVLFVEAATVFYPGPSIGNFTTEEALALMKQLYAQCAVQSGVLSVHLDVTGNPTLPGARSFAAGKTLHTKNSVKYTAQAFTALLFQAGFTQIRQWTDARDYAGLFTADA